MDKKLFNTTKYLRIVIQIVFFIMMPSAFSSAFAAVKEAAVAISQGGELGFTPFAKIFLFLLAFTMICGRFFCGYACAFGSLGNWIYMISQFIQKKVGKKLPSIPSRTARYLQLIKYVVLLAIVILCFAGFSGMVSESSPWTVFSLLINGKLPTEAMIVGAVILLLILVGMAFRQRFFCQFLCPLGAIFSLLPILPTGRMVRKSEGCIKGCNLCERKCPMDLKLGENEWREGECIQCRICSYGCPKSSISMGMIPRGYGDIVWTVIEAAILMAVLKFVI